MQRSIVHCSDGSAAQCSRKADGPVVAIPTMSFLSSTMTSRAEEKSAAASNCREGKSTILSEEDSQNQNQHDKLERPQNRTEKVNQVGVSRFPSDAAAMHWGQKMKQVIAFLHRVERIDFHTHPVPIPTPSSSKYYLPVSGWPSLAARRPPVSTCDAGQGGCLGTCEPCGSAWTNPAGRYPGHPPPSSLNGCDHRCQRSHGSNLPASPEPQRRTSSETKSPALTEPPPPDLLLSVAAVASRISVLRSWLPSGSLDDRFWCSLMSTNF